MYHSKSATPVDDEKDFEKGRIRLEDDRVDRDRDGDVNDGDVDDGDDDVDDSDDIKGFKSQRRSALLTLTGSVILDFGFCHTFWF